MATMTQAAPPSFSPAGVDAPRAPGDAPAPPVPPAAPNGQRRTWVLAAGIVIGLIIVAVGARAIWFATTHESTDDAQVDGHITPISPRIGGYVVSIRVQDNQQVRAGDTLVVTFPIGERTVKEKLGDTVYTLVIKGNTVVSIDPAGKDGALYARANYRENQARWRKTTRFVPEQDILW